MSCVIGGCASPAITWAGFYGLGGLAVSGGTLFWPAGQGPAGDAGALGSSPQIMSCPTNGCTAAATVASVNDNITTFAIDGPNAFWTVKSGSIESCPLTGCGGAPLVLASQQAMPWGIAVDSTSVYWTNVDDGTVLSCPRSGCTGGPSILASGQQRPTAVAAFAGNVYWINLGLPNGGGKQPVTSYAGGSVMKCSVAGSGSQPVALFAYPTWLGGAAIAADSSNVYWSMEDSSGKFGEIVKCSSAGCASGPSGIGTTSTNHDPTVGLALDAANVYWSDPGAGAILTAGK